MNEKFEKIIPVFILVYFLIIAPLILYNYSVYLQKPDKYIWDEVKRYLISSGKYNEEPIIFNPEWLKNYAVDYGRFREFNVPENDGVLKQSLAAALYNKNKSDFPVYWLISMNDKSIPNNYQIITNKKIGNLFILKLKRDKT